MMMGMRMMRKGEIVFCLVISILLRCKGRWTREMSEQIRTKCTWKYKSWARLAQIEMLRQMGTKCRWKGKKRWDNVAKIFEKLGKYYGQAQIPERRYSVKPQNSRRPILNRCPRLIMNGDQVNCMKIRSRRFGPVMLITAGGCPGASIIKSMLEKLSTHVVHFVPSHDIRLLGRMCHAGVQEAGYQNKYFTLISPPPQILVSGHSKLRKCGAILGIFTDSE